ncbi:MAG TPA: branched-chain amino acid ABC transporter permease [Gaiellaceae bacterium]|nr:branched-chain amino acid ABC transporter permease [Gaiellaceae bacterium]
MTGRLPVYPLLGLAVGAAAIVALPHLVSDFRQFQLAYVGVYFIAALGLNILTGYSGQISLGHGGFMMIGAYTTAILSVSHGVRDVWTIPLAGLVAGAIGFAFGFPALRLRGVYLALATFAIPVALIAIAKRYDVFGNQTLNRIISGNEVYWLTWPIAGGLLVLAWLLMRGRFGRALRTIRESEVAAVSMGVNLALYKTVAFGISAAYAGIAGALYALAVAYVNPDTFPIALSILLLTGVVVGGLGALSGVVFGALFVEYVPLYSPNILNGFQKVVPLHLDAKAAGAPAVVYGIILLLVLYLIPDGVAGLLRRTVGLPGRVVRRGRPAEAPAPVARPQD